MTAEVKAAFKIAEELEKIFSNVNKEVCGKLCSDVKKGCCNGCWTGQGYVAPKEFIILKKYFKFSEETGFLDVKQGGCTLPRVLRSGGCLMYYCDEVGKTIESPIESPNDCSNLPWGRTKTLVEDLISIKRLKFNSILKVVLEGGELKGISKKSPIKNEGGELKCI